MGFQGPRAAPPKVETRRAPPRVAPSAVPAPAAPSAPAQAEDHEFPDAYQSDGLSTLLARPAPTLNPGIERLIELAANRMGCPHEETLALKAEAMERPAAIVAYCQHVFDTRERPLREAVDPLAAPRAAGLCAFWIEGAAGKAIATAPMSEAIRPYDGQRLELYDPRHTPFADLFNPATFQAERQALIDAKLARKGAVEQARQEQAARDLQHQSRPATPAAEMGIHIHGAPPSPQAPHGASDPGAFAALGVADHGGRTEPPAQMAERPATPSLDAPSVRAESEQTLPTPAAPPVFPPMADDDEDWGL